jgi:hypothetical protein
MKIRIYTPFLPFPPSEGGLQHIFNQIEALARLGHEVETVCWLNSPAEVQKAIAKNPAAWNERVKILCFQETKPVSRTANEWAQVFVGEGTSISPLHFSKWRRSWRVLTSLYSASASPEDYYFPKHLDRRKELPSVDLEIIHYSFSYNWLAKNAKNTSQRTAVYFQNIESDLLKSGRSALKIWNSLKFL